MINHMHITQPYTEHIRRHLKNIWIPCWKGLPHSASKRQRGWEKGILTRDSSGVESDRYETVVRPNRRKRRIFEKVKRLFYLKYHIVAILDYLIILKVSVTSYKVADCTMLRRMLKSLSSFPGSVFEADMGFDAEYIFKKVFDDVP